MIRVTKSEWRSLSIAVLVSTATMMLNHRPSAAQVAPTFEASVLTEINKIRATPQAHTTSTKQAKRPINSAPKIDEIERAIVDETNRLRSNPQAYAAELAELRQYFKGNILKVPGYPALETHEGIAAVDEAIRDLKATSPLPALTISQGLSLGAKDHVLDLAPKGKAGHYGTDGSDPFQRINRYGTWNGAAGENISFSPIATARWHVMQLVIDDGVKNRGHRKALLNPNYRLTGSACGDHSVYGQMCVMTYSKEYTEGNLQGRR